MNLKYLFMGALASMALLSCQKEDNTTAPKNEESSQEGEEFMAVRFTMSGGQTKGDGDFVAGTDDEVAVSSIRFLFFKDGAQVADPYDVAGSSFSWTDGTGSVDQKSKAAILVLANKTADPTSIIAVANPDATTKAALTKSLSMTGLKALYGNWADASHTTNGTFLMTNAAYVSGTGDDATVVVGTPVDSTNIGKTAAEANANPVTISIEKAVAKVHVSQSTEFENNTEDTLGTTPITFVVNKWWIDHDPTYGALVKPLSASYSWTDWDWTNFTWNDASNFRSYWADQFGTPGDYQHRSVNDGVAAASYAYTNENATISTSDEDATQVVVEGNLQVNNDTVSIIEYQTSLYTKDGFETILANLLSDVYKVESQSGSTITYTSVTKDDLKFTYTNNTASDTVMFNGVAIKDYESVVTVSFQTLAQGQLYKKAVDGTASTMSQDEIDAALANVNLKILYYKGGRTYYFFKIRHSKDAVYTDPTDATITHPLYGVIRNHLYEITLSGVTGLGTPLPQPDDFDVTPDTPVDNNSYISAEIDILKYKEVDQDVVLGE